jgi:hypothetical protein
MIVLSHRGLDLNNASGTGESTMAAFESAVRRGFGIEVDLQMSADGVFLLWHDYDLNRWTQGRLNSLWQELSAREIRALQERWGKLCWWSDLVDLRARHPDIWIAIHLKSRNQTDQVVKRLQDELRKLPSRERILVFDLFPAVAAELRSAFSDLGLAVSATHSYDVTRFSAMTGGTLLTLEAAVDSMNGICDWLWLDEWDRQAGDGSVKDIYDVDWIRWVRSLGFRLAAISPELHKVDGHEDSMTEDALVTRWRQMFARGLDAICTDYPTRLMESL